MPTLNFKSILESAPGAYLILLPDLTIIAVSDTYLNATMTQRNDIIGKNLFNVFPDNPDDPGATGESNLRESMRLVLEKRSEHKMAPQKYDIRRPDGSFEERHWDPLNKPVLNAKKEVEYIIHAVEDITERVRSEAHIRQLNAEIARNSINHMNELEKSNKLFFTLFNLNPASIAISRVDDGRLLHVNESFLRLFGFSSKDDVIGKTAEELSIYHDSGKRAEILTELKKNGRVLGAEGQIRIPGAPNKWASTSVDIVEIENTPCLLAVTLDISKRKAQEELLLSQAAELEQANKELETFSYSVSHDLKAPLRALQGFSKLLEEEYGNKFDEEGKRWLQFIAVNASKMGALIGDILSFSQVSRSMASKSKVNMQQLAREVYDLEKNNYPDKPIQFLLGNLPEAFGDGPMLRQVWQNLISNALKYSSQKKSISVSVSGKVENGFTVYSVKDEGAGFDEKYKDKLFGVFQRLHSTEEFEGTGVGLAIVNRIIQKHQGWIKATGEKGLGAEFTFAIPNTNTHQT